MLGLDWCGSPCPTISHKCPRRHFCPTGLRCGGDGGVHGLVPDRLEVAEHRVQLLVHEEVLRLQVPVHLLAFSRQQDCEKYQTVRAQTPQGITYKELPKRNYLVGIT